MLSAGNVIDGNGRIKRNTELEKGYVISGFYKGRAFDAYTYFGAHIEGTGVWFRVYAPAAKAVYVIGDFQAGTGSGWITATTVAFLPHM